MTQNQLTSFPTVTDLTGYYVPVVKNGVNAKAAVASFGVNATFIDVTNPRWGATGNGTTDDTAAINAAFDYVRANSNPTNPAGVVQAAASFIVYFPPGNYRTTSGINATGIRNRVWGIKGPGRILADFNGGNVLDLTFSRFCHIEDLLIATATGRSPAIGVLFARNNSGAVADVHYCEKLNIYGNFSTACLFNYAAEDHTQVACSFYNTNTSLTSYVAMLDGSNRTGVTSAFQTIPANTPASFNDYHCVRGDYRKDGGPLVYMTHTEGHHFDNGYFAGFNDSIFVIRTTAVDINTAIILDGHFEADGLLNVVRFDGDATQTVNGLKVLDYAPRASQDIFRPGTGVTSITINDLKVEIDRYGVTPSNGLFGTPGAFTLSKPDIRSPSYNLWDGITFASSGAAVSHTGDTNEFVVATIAFPPNILGLNGVIEFDTFWDWPASANTKTMRARLGPHGSGITGDIFLATVDSTGTAQSLHDRRLVSNKNSLTSQVAQNGAATGGWGTTNQLASSGSQDTTTALDLVFTIQLTNAGDTVTLRRYTVKILLQ